DRVVLLDDRLDIRPQAPAHLVVDTLPCPCLTLRWQASGLTVEALGGVVMNENQDMADDPDQGRHEGLVIPGQLAIDADISEREQLCRTILFNERLERIIL